VPRCELRSKVDLILELAVLEERALHPADQALDGPLLVTAARRAHLDADAEIHDRLGEGGVELLDLTPLAALLDDRPGAVEHRHERQATEGHEVAGQTAHDRLDTLVVDERDGHEARVLQSRREEVHALPLAVHERHVGMAEVVLRELARQSLEANHGCGARRPHRGHEPIESALAARVACLGRATQELLRR
jgi:hypothetical protein